MNNRSIAFLLCTFCALSTSAAAAAESPNPSLNRAELEILPQSVVGLPALPYDKVLIEEVEISYDATSPYQRLKPEHRARLEDATAQAIRAAVGGRFVVVDAPGPGVLRVQAAIVGIRAEQKPKRFWSYTPFGLVKRRVDAATGRDFTLLSAVVAVELYDGETDRRLAAVADFTGDAVDEGDEPLSFRTLIASIGGWTHRLLVGLATA